MNYETFSSDTVTALSMMNDAQYTDFEKQLLSQYDLLADTCTLRHEAFINFMQRNAAYLQEKNIRLLVPAACKKELEAQAGSNDARNKIESLRALALFVALSEKKLLEILDTNIKTGISNFADPTIFSFLETRCRNKPQCILTEDKNLTRQCTGLNNTLPQNAFPVLVLRFNPKQQKTAVQRLLCNTYDNAEEEG